MTRQDIDIDFFKNKLEAEKERLERELNLLGRKVGPNDWVAVPEAAEPETSEFDEIADKIEDFESNVAVLNVLEEEYQNVIDALKKISDGTFGIDEKTGEPIDKERLLAMPTAKHNL